MTPLSSIHFSLVLPMNVVPLVNLNLILAPLHCISPSAVLLVRRLVFSSSHSLILRFLVETVSLLLSHRSISPNAIHPPVSGTTALHLAASLGRADVVNLLLEQDTIDDTLRDSNGRSCTDVARGKDVLSVINGKSTPPNAITICLRFDRLSCTSYCILPVSAPYLHPLFSRCAAFPVTPLTPILPAC